MLKVYSMIRYLEVGNEKWDLESLNPIRLDLTSKIQEIKNSKSRTSHIQLQEFQIKDIPLHTSKISTL